MKLLLLNFQNYGKILISLLSDGKKYCSSKAIADKCYPDSAPLETMVKRRHADFKHNHTDTNDAECSGRPNSAVVPENTKKTSTNSFLADR